MWDRGVLVDEVHEGGCVCGAVRYLLVALCLAALNAGCAQQRASGKVLEQALISPDQKIAILWTLGSFDDRSIDQVLLREGTYGNRYELCTNALLERTFRANGYVVQARKLQPGERPAVPAEVRYALLLRNTAVRFQANRSGSFSSPFPSVLLDVEGDLVDRKSGKRLWTVYNWLSSDARRNSIPAVHLVRGLAADGYLDLKPEDVADYLGARVKSDEEISIGCP
jgi:hypothetical protein